MTQQPRGARTLAIAMVVMTTVIGASAVGPSDAATGAPTFLGPYNSRVETATTSWGRDGGITVPLPGGNLFWVFGDTPRYQFQEGRWKLTKFVYGNSAGIVPYLAGRKPKAFTEIVPGKPTKPTNQPAQFLPSPTLYMPDGTGRLCNKRNGGLTAGAVRWVTGAALLPDQTNILISYMGVCVLSADDFTVQAWGFAEFNRKTKRFTVPPIDVFGPSTTGEAIPTNIRFGSPVVADGAVTFFSLTCCSLAAIYTATIPNTVADLSNPASYTRRVVNGIPLSPLVSVHGKTATHPHLSMYQLGSGGSYRLLRAPSPSGPWTQEGTGQLPGCASAPRPCSSVHLHPELSSPSEMIVTYWLPGYGPGVPGHPDPSDEMNHIVMASLPV